MAYLQEQMEILRFDKRLLEINLKNGSITEEQYKEYLTSLEDVESRSEKLVLDNSSVSDDSVLPEAKDESPVTNSFNY